MTSAGVARQMQVGDRATAGIVTQAMRARRILTGLLLAALALAACSSGSGRSTRVAAPTTTAPPASASAIDAPSTTAATPVPPSVTTATTAAPAAAASSAGRCPPAPPRLQPRGDRTRYHVVADVQPEARTAAGTVDAAFTPDLATDRIVLRLWPNAPNMAAGGA